MATIALALGALAQPRDQHRYTEHEQRNGRYTSGRASGQPHSEDECGEEEREQCRQADDVMGNTVWIANDLIGREGLLVDGLVRCCAHVPPGSRLCATRTVAIPAAVGRTSGQ